MWALAAATQMSWCLRQAAERQALEDDLHVKHGHQLFAAGEYEQAMVRLLLTATWRLGVRFSAMTLRTPLHLQTHSSFVASVLQVQFGMCSSANPVVLLSLFPSLAPEELLSPVLHLFAGAVL
jgi:hypothetical protein